jgi:hypothetical protein
MDPRFGKKLEEPYRRHTIAGAYIDYDLRISDETNKAWKHWIKHDFEMGKEPGIRLHMPVSKVNPMKVFL